MNRYLISFVSIGWIAPLFLSVHHLLNFLEYEMPRHLNGNDQPYSYQTIQFSSVMFTMATLWLAAVLFYWVYLWTGYLGKNIPKTGKSLAGK